MAAVIVSLRPMTGADVAAVAALEEECFDEPWSVRVLFDELAAPRRSYVVAEDSQGRVIGYAGVMVAAGEAHVMTIAVAPSDRSRGIGTRLMLETARLARDAGAEHMTLEVRDTNETAIRLYERFGFRPAGRRRRYYRDGDAIVMWAHDVGGEDYEALLQRIAGEVR